MKSIFMFLIILSPVTINISSPYNFIIWNVGQGSWATLIERKTCYHIDMGGEKAPLHLIFKKCQRRENVVFITHLDWDHINKIKIFSRNVDKLCLFPIKELQKKTKASLWLKTTLLCKENISSPIQIIHRPQGVRNKNQSSLIYVIKGTALISGDSPSSEEKVWAKKVPTSVSILILGHHGSLTSTSTYLLETLNISLAIASARKERFGHPHKKIEERLKKFKVPLLLTQEWDHLYFNL